MLHSALVQTARVGQSSLNTMGRETYETICRMLEGTHVKTRREMTTVEYNAYMRLYRNKELFHLDRSNGKLYWNNKLVIPSDEFGTHIKSTHKSTKGSGARKIYYSMAETKTSIPERAIQHFYLPPVFKNGGRYCFGFRRRIHRPRCLRRLRGCFALYLGCY